MASELFLDRLEFKTVNVRCNLKAACESDESFPQLKVDFSQYELLHRAGLTYDMSAADDPRYFALSYGVKMQSKTSEPMPYDVEIEAVAFLHYEGEDHAGADRFRAVRFSGYQMIHGAIREMLANITSRARHGVMQLPARNFNAQAKADADSDEQMRLEYIQNQVINKKRSARRRPKRLEGPSDAVPTDV